MALTVIRQNDLSDNRFVVCAQSGRYWYVQEYLRSPIMGDERITLLRTHGGEWTTEEGALFEYNRLFGENRQS